MKICVADFASAWHGKKQLIELTRQIRCARAIGGIWSNDGL
jgi:hypothetical protein